MSNLQVIADKVVKLKQIRHLWSRIACDLVYMSLPQAASSAAITYEDVASAYHLTIQDLCVLSGMEDFIKLVEKERDRAKQMGHRAGFLMRSEAIATELVETMYSRLCKSDAVTEVKDLIKAVELMIKVSGLSAEKDSSGSGGPTVAIQFNMPELNNTKLNHIKQAGV